MNNFEFYVAKKYIKTRRQSNYITIISLISIIGISIGIAALIIALSVFNGFQELAYKIFLSNDPHIKIIFSHELSQSSFNKIQDAVLKYQDECSEINEFVEGKILLMKDRQSFPMILKGYKNLYLNGEDNLQSKFKYGSYLSSNVRAREILLGIFFAARNGISSNDSVFILSFDGLARSVSSFSLPPMAKFKVCGIYESFNKDFDLTYAFSSFENAKKLLGRHSKSDGIELRLKNPYRSFRIIEELSRIIIKNDAIILSWKDLRRDLYLMMNIEKIAAFVILILIIAVASFNLMGSLSMTVLEKKRDIALLRALGAESNSIKKIFMFEGLLISFIGIAIGSIIGYGVCYAQIYFKIYPLDGTRYIVDALPVLPRWEDFIFISLASFALTFLASYIPAKKASETQIAQSIKWE